MNKDRIIPIYNIYQMLRYVYGMVNENSIVRSDKDSNTDAANLLASVLIKELEVLNRKGLKRSYSEFNEELRGPKGQIDFNSTIAKQSLRNSLVFCDYDVLTENIYANQVISSTINHLQKIKSLDKEIKRKLQKQNNYFLHIDSFRITPYHFSSPNLRNLQPIYKLIISICQLIVKYILVDENTGRYTFQDLFNDEKQMHQLFENFIREFYSREIRQRYPDREYKVKRDNIDWLLDHGISEYDKSYLPKMKTDISISFDKIKYIIDTKYYKDALRTSQYGKKVVNSSHLYQVYSYLMNDTYQEKKQGILLYPTVNYELDISFPISGSFIKISTVNLGDSNFDNIANKLLNLVE